MTTKMPSMFVALVLVGCLLHASIHSAAASEDDEKYVTCGSAVKLLHVQSEKDYYLYSENSRNQGGGSGQQIVTFSNQHKNSPNTLWWVHAAHDTNCTTAEPIKCGDAIRLSHIPTKRNLHSHAIQSSLSRQNEVTCWGDDYDGDGGDDWIVRCQGKNWKRSSKIRLYHRDTTKYLGASMQVMYNERNCGQGCPIRNHLEAFGWPKADEYTIFQVEAGVFLSG